MIWSLIKLTSFTRSEGAQQIQRSSPSSEPMPLTQCTRRLKFRYRSHKPRSHHCNSCLEYGHRIRWTARATSDAAPHVFHHPDPPGRTSSLHTLDVYTARDTSPPFAEICHIRKQRNHASAGAALRGAAPPTLATDGPLHGITSAPNLFSTPPPDLTSRRCGGAAVGTPHAPTLPHR